MINFNSMENDLKISKNKTKRVFWFTLGIISTCLGIAGYILPVMPGTTFILIAVFCFARSSEKWYNKLLESKWFGQTIKDFKAKKGITLKTKINATIMILTSIGISLYFASNIYVSIFLVTCCMISLYFVHKQKTKPCE
jgi:uncharacterized membrane protein YbaN (DUF454 family)